MLVHCNSKFRPYEIWFLHPNSEYYNRSVEFGICPHCLHEVICVIETRKLDGFTVSKYIRKRDIDKARDLYKGEIEYKSSDITPTKSSPYGWVYGVNKTKVDKKSGEVTYTQESCDFYGNKEVVKKYKQT